MRFSSIELLFLILLNLLRINLIFIKAYAYLFKKLLSAKLYVMFIISQFLYVLTLFLNLIFLKYICFRLTLYFAIAIYLFLINDFQFFKTYL